MKGVMEDFLEFITGRSMSPVSNHVLQVRPEYKRSLIDKEQATSFHHTMA